MEELSKIYLDKKIHYTEIISKSFIRIKKFNYNIDVTIIIPLFGRSEQIQPLIDHIKKAMFYHNKLKYRIIFIEQDIQKHICAKDWKLQNLKELERGIRI